MNVLRKILTFGVLPSLLLVGNTFGQTPRPLDVAGAMRGRDMSVPAERAAVAEIIRNRQAARKAAAVARARQLGIPERTIEPSGRVREVADMDEAGRLLYHATCNLNAAISSGASQIRQTTPYNPDGSGVTVGVWDEGSVRNTHQEFTTTRVVNRNAGAALNEHATHVAGTIGASGVQASAKGMSPAVAIDSYDWNSDLAEMIAAGATSASDSSKIPISNHSYTITFSDVALDTAYMGRYTTQAADNDAAAVNAPFYLPFWAAGNAQGSLTAKSGFQSIIFEALGKNTLTVGAVNDAVSGGLRSPANGTMSSFSSWGPCDDGRIKPDLVANGVGVYSTTVTSDTSYGSKNGTSMATPSAAGSAALLAQLYAREFSGQLMRASLLKGLLIHTADDLGNAGPDYKFGWGLIDVKEAADLILLHKSVTAHPRFFENNVTSGTKTRTHTFQWDGTSPIRATLCWIDPAGAAQADNSRTAVLRHNLDLRITAPDGSTVYQPYVMPFVGTWTDASMNSLATTGKNNVDNVEQVYIATPTQAGTYTVTVSLDGNLVAGQTQQVYSLIVSGSPLNAAPTISDIADQATTVGNTVGPIPFTINDAETSASSLVLSVASSNPTLVPSGNVAFGGSGANRTVTVTPATGVTGSSTVTVTVSDGVSTTSDFFVVAVNAVPDIAVEEYRGADSSSASTYTDGLFAGRNGGDGFGVWSASASGVGGNYIGVTSVRSRSFAVYSGSGIVGNSAEATRVLGTPLAVGESLGVQLGYTGIANGGEIGMNFFSGGSFRLGLKFIGGSDQWVLNAGGSNFGTGIGWAGGTPLQVVFRRNAGDGYSIMVVSGARSYSAANLTSILGVMSIDSVQFYSSAQGANEHLGFDALTRGLDVAVASPFNLGSVQVGSSGSARTYIVRNDGGASLSGISSAKSGANPNDFVIGGTIPTSLAAGAGSSFTLTFSPTAAGSRSATVSITSNDPDEGTVNFDLNGAGTQGGATIVLGNLNQSYDGTARPVSITTTPPGLAVGVTYNGSASAPTNAGTYDVVATVNDANYAGTASATLIVSKATAPITLGNLNQTHNGTPRVATATTVPPGLVVNFTYNGLPLPPSAVGSYAVVATVDDANYSGSTSGTLVISNAVPTFDEWASSFGGLSDATPGGDPDGDGASNAMEYFMGLDPTLHDSAGSVVQQVAAEAVLFDYRRSKAINGMTGAVKWSTAPGVAAMWSSQSVTDVPLTDYGTYEWRRATLPWTSEQGDVFLRLDLTLE